MTLAENFIGLYRLGGINRLLKFFFLWHRLRFLFSTCVHFPNDYDITYRPNISANMRTSIKSLKLLKTREYYVHALRPICVKMYSKNVTVGNNLTPNSLRFAAWYYNDVPFEALLNQDIIYTIL